MFFTFFSGFCIVVNCSFMTGASWLLFLLFVPLFKSLSIVPLIKFY